ncbi:MAG: TolC family protein [Gemmataceae bacterium]
MTRRWLVPVCLCFLACLIGGCSVTGSSLLSYIILPEQTTLPVHDPARLPSAPIPPIPPPITVTDRQPDAGEWRISLDQAIRIALKNARVIRVLAGITADSSGRTVYDVAIANTAIDQRQALFDPTFDWRNTWNHIDAPFAINPLTRNLALLTANQVDDYRSDVSLRKKNLLGGEWSTTWLENPAITKPGFLLQRPVLNPSNASSLETRYTQPLLQGAGFLVNTAPIIIARLDTERSYFQYKDSVQELVRGVIEAYWNLVQARVDVWARQIQVDTAEEAYKREKARMDVGLAALSDVAQSRVTFTQFRANLIAARANVLLREGALRNIMGLPPSDHLVLVPDSAPSTQRYRANWPLLLELAEQRRPDIVELKLVLEADQLRLIQAENRTLPQLNAEALYRWNGLSGELQNGRRVSSDPGQFTDWTIGINFSVPLFLREGRAQVREQSLIISRDRANLDQALHRMTHTLTINLRDLDSFYEQYEAYKETHAAATDNLRVQIEQFNAGRTIYLNVLQALNDWGNAITSEAQFLTNYNTALATLERQTGTILETHGLVFAEERQRWAGPLGLFGHGREYPAALPPNGDPQRYPSGEKKSEDFFDLQKPNLRGSRDKDPTPDKPAGKAEELLPPPRRVLPPPVPER